jgi:MICOS complex subunit MIC19
MGQSQSTPSSGSGPADSTKHVFTASTPINFSSELISSLQSSSETNSTRAKQLDLHIAQRVHEELAKLQADQTSAVEAAKEKILREAEESKGSEEDKQSLKDKVREKIAGQVGEEQGKKEQSSQKVLDEIERLKRELGQRKVLRELPKEVESARDGVVACLRANDRRPLDCWKEVEVFKREVRRMEAEFVSKVL